VVGVLALAGFLGQLQGAEPVPMALGAVVGKPAPDFKLEGSDGKTYELAQFRGKHAVVLVWNPIRPGSG